MQKERHYLPSSAWSRNRMKLLVTCTRQHTYTQFYTLGNCERVTRVRKTEQRARENKERLDWKGCTREQRGNKTAEMRKGRGRVGDGSGCTCGAVHEIIHAWLTEVCVCGSLCEALCISHEHFCQGKCNFFPLTSSILIYATFIVLYDLVWDQDWGTTPESWTYKYWWTKSRETNHAAQAWLVTQSLFAVSSPFPHPPPTPSLSLVFSNSLAPLSLSRSLHSLPHFSSFRPLFFLTLSIINSPHLQQAQRGEVIFMSIFTALEEDNNRYLEAAWV